MTSTNTIRLPMARSEPRDDLVNEPPPPPVPTRPTAITLPSTQQPPPIPMRTDACFEISEVLRTLEESMKQHMAALERRKEKEPASEKLPAAAPPPVPQSLGLPTSASPRPSFVLNPCDLPRLEKTVIYCHVVFVKIGEIDTIKDRYSGEAFVNSRWREPALDGRRDTKAQNINWSNYWSPKLKIDNNIGELKEQINKSITFDGSGRASIVEKRKVAGTFFETMELNQFPFDTQDLTVTLTSEWTLKEVEIAEDTQKSSGQNIQSFTGEQEWHLHKRVFTWTKIRVDENKTPKTRHGAFSASCKVSRRTGFYIYNIFLVMFLICTLVFTTWAVDLNLPQNRLQLSFILLLTTVSFKFVVNQALPMISYLTYMDKYILTAMIIICGICAWHATIPVINGSPPSGKCCTNESVWYDQIALMIAGATYFGFQFMFGLIMFFVVKMVNDEVASQPEPKEQPKKKKDDDD